MAENRLTVTVITPEKNFHFDNVFAFFAPGKLGNFEVLPMHISMISELEIGIMSIAEGTSVQKMSISNGFCEIKENNIRVLVESAEREKDIDVKRAQEAKLRAEERLKNKKDPDLDVHRAELALARALNRLKLKHSF